MQRIYCLASGSHSPWWVFYRGWTIVVFSGARKPWTICQNAACEVPWYFFVVKIILLVNFELRIQLKNICNKKNLQVLMGNLKSKKLPPASSADSTAAAPALWQLVLWYPRRKITPIVDPLEKAHQKLRTDHVRRVLDLNDNSWQQDLGSRWRCREHEPDISNNSESHSWLY